MLAPVHPALLRPGTRSECDDVVAVLERFLNRVDDTDRLTTPLAPMGHLLEVRVEEERRTRRRHDHDLGGPKVEGRPQDGSNVARPSWPAENNALQGRRG